MLYLPWKTSRFQSHLYISYFARVDAICAIQKTWKKTNGGVLVLVNLKTESCIFTKSSTSPWVLKVPKNQVLKVMLHFSCIYYQAKLLNTIAFITWKQTFKNNLQSICFPSNSYIFKRSTFLEYFNFWAT